MIRSSKKTAAKRRAEQKVINAVRPIVAERDGYCRIVKDRIYFATHMIEGFDRGEGVLVELGPCAGFSEWAHLGEFKRFKTRKQAPELRHSTQHTAQMCSRHHRAYDANQFVIEELTPDGADGPLAYRLK